MSLAMILSIPIATSLLLFPVLQMLVVGPQNFFRQVGGTIWILNTTTTLFLFVSILILREMKPHPLGGQGLGIFFFTEVIVSDAMQYVGGKLLGKTPLIPSISPGKTVEGALFGATVSGAVGALLGPSLLGVSGIPGFAIGASLCALSLAGDLIVSAWKRDAGVKDTGNVLPGQGGVLDRCDSILYVAPWFWFFVNFLI
jgi:phosphatidate cytidylyltransferase